MRVLVVIVALCALWIAWEVLRLPGSMQWRAFRRARKERERIATLDAERLLVEIRRAIRFEQWERFAAAQQLLTRDDWTNATLFETLNELYAEVAREPAISKRDSNMFEFHDCGLASIVEVLERRLRD